MCQDRIVSSFELLTSLPRELAIGRREAKLKTETTKKLILSQKLERSPNFELIHQITNTFKREAIALDI